jgi:ribonuclease R
MTLDENQNLQSINIETSSPSHSLVEECMLLANQEAAKKLGNIGIFRVHEEPSTAKIKKLLQDLEDLGINAQLKTNLHKTIESLQAKAQNYGLESEVDELIIQSQQQAYYSNLKASHFGLGFSNYSHFTSPIRRYSDLVLHRMLKTKQIPSNIEDICEKISTTEREIANLVWDYEDRKYARAAQKLRGKTFEAKIVDLEKRLGKITQGILTGAKVEIENYSGEKLFLKVNLKIVSSDILSKNITAIIV